MRLGDVVLGSDYKSDSEERVGGSGDVEGCEDGQIYISAAGVLGGRGGGSSKIGHQRTRRDQQEHHSAHITMLDPESGLFEWARLPRPPATTSLTRTTIHHVRHLIALALAPHPMQPWTCSRISRHNALLHVELYVQVQVMFNSPPLLPVNTGPWTSPARLIVPATRSAEPNLWLSGRYGTSAEQGQLVGCMIIVRTPSGD